MPSGADGTGSSADWWDVRGLRGTGRWSGLVVAASLLLAGCESEPVASTTTVLRVLMADDWAGVDPVLDAVRAFEARHPDVQVDVEGVPFSSIATTVDASIRAGDPYDLAQWHAFAAGARGMAEPVDDLWADQLDQDEFLPGAIDDVIWAGRAYGVPLDTNAMVIVANADHLEEAGYGTEGFATVDEVWDAAQQLSEPFGLRRAMAHSLSTWSAYGWITALGGEVVEVADDGQPTFLLDAPATVAALDFLGRTVTEGLAYEPDTRNRSGAMVDLFLDGRVTMIATGGWDLVAANEAARRAGEDAPRAVALPVPRRPDGSLGGTALGGSSLFIPTGSPSRELAFDFARALIEDDIALALAQQEGRLPVRRRVLDDPAFAEPTMQVVREHLEIARPMKLIAFDQAQEAFTLALEEILTGRRSAEEALAWAQRLAEESVAGDPS